METVNDIILEYLSNSIEGRITLYNNEFQIQQTNKKVFYNHTDVSLLVKNVSIACGIPNLKDIEIVYKHRHCILVINQDKHGSEYLKLTLCNIKMHAVLELKSRHRLNQIKQLKQSTETCNKIKQTLVETLPSLSNIFELYIWD